MVSVASPAYPPPGAFLRDADKRLRTVSGYSPVEVETQGSPLPRTRHSDSSPQRCGGGTSPIRTDIGRAKRHAFHFLLQLPRRQAFPRPLSGVALALLSLWQPFFFRRPADRGISPCLFRRIHSGRFGRSPTFFRRDVLGGSSLPGANVRAKRRTSPLSPYFFSFVVALFWVTERCAPYSSEESDPRPALVSGIAGEILRGTK